MPGVRGYAPGTDPLDKKIARWKSGADPTRDATSVNPQASIIPSNAPVRGGAQDTGGPSKVYGPGEEK